MTELKALTEGDSNLSAARLRWNEGRGPKARALLARDEAGFIRQSLSTPCLEAVESALGATLTLVDGQRILDFHGNSVHQVGYGHPHVVAAVQDELVRLPFSPRRYTNRPAVELAERLAGLTGGRLCKVLFAPSGTAAIGMALKLARYATGRHKTISMWDSFHGAGLDAISIGGEALFRRDVGPLLPGTEHVPPLDLAERFFGAGEEGARRLADYIDYVLEVQGDVAAVIAEPMRWTSVQPPHPGFWPRVRESCDRHGALLIFDEIPSGLARSGTMFVHEQVGAVPDILVLGKGLGGGIMPIAAMLVRDGLDRVPEAALGHYTHEKSPLGARAALATLEVIEAERLKECAAHLGGEVLARLAAMVDELDLDAKVRGLGAYWGVELAGADGPALAERVLYASLERGLSFKIGGGNVLTLCPPLTIAEDELDAALGILADALAVSLADT